MENEVSGIAKLGIVLIALAVLIALGFGIFQISKSTANSGVNDVQAELDGVATSAFTTYDQQTVTGTMVSSALSDFEGENTAILIATQAWVNLMYDNTADPGAAFASEAMTDGSGFSGTYSTDGAAGTTLPIVWAYSDSAYTNSYLMNSSNPGTAGAGNASTDGAFINYNAILGSTVDDAAGTSDTETCTINGTSINMGKVYFDSNCFRCVSGYATDASGRVMFNNIIGNTNKTGRTEYIPSGGKFSSYLIKDASGTTVGVAFQQVNNQ